MIGAVTLLTGCGGGSAPQPSPTTSGLQGPDGGSTEPDHGWLITATTQYMTGSTRVCSFQPVLPATPHDHEIGWNGNGTFVLFEQDPFTDTWRPSDPPLPLGPNHLVFDFDDNSWEGYQMIGEAGQSGRIVWQTFGEFTPQLDANGLLLGATGTGDTFHDVIPDLTEYLDETLTVTVEPAPDAPWCAEARLAWGY